MVSGEKDKVFSSKIKYDGLMDFKEFYKFCYQWLIEEPELEVIENKYAEKISGDAKNIDVEWTGFRKVTDYFKFQVIVKFKVINLTNVEVLQDGKKLKMNKGSVEVSISGTLVKDYDGKFEHTSTQKFMRSIYEKWVIPSRVKEYEDKLVKACNDFLAQAKAFLDLEGKTNF
ncbi:MAG: hypothetical protein BWY36_00795 [Candidatus Diapherotrites archaeon ADurb.Bin253]|nr:MAG: hypothetical protein BWY36_00795 [Candidatus Diapherotrites archaeon ADurb.Bin253]HNZ52445.1 hypothetical protein [Candidatus Pacearchaeota archaeon]HPX74893.1 hypothetical protein [Candidatus Pacearchaeota archaeon]HQC61103.1 hypothetical protein [Candidatus Pacearchaeota archaeon]